MAETEGQQPGDVELQRLLAVEAGGGRRRRIIRRLVFTVVVLVAAGLAAVYFFGRNGRGAAVEYRTAAAVRGDLTVTVTATGNLEPTNQVEVGSEVSGTIETVMVDYNDAVTAGQVLARLDTTKLEAQANQSRAAVASARAALLQAEATLAETAAELARLERVRELSDGRLPSRHELDAARAAERRAEADVARARAGIAEAEARLGVDETNLEKATIYSPVDGVVLVRSVDPGQTVAASLQAPVLFTLAEDLRRMELQVDVDEADVGQVREGQGATFTVDAWPERTFPARIVQVRYGSQSSEGVVTYPTVLDVENTDLTLRPGMTATADIVVRELHDALLVPNAALRYAPPPAAKTNGTAGGSLLSKLFPRPARTRPQRTGNGGGVRQGRRVWTLRDGKPVGVPVTVGATDGVLTEIIGGEVALGMPLIIESVSRKP
ncbi:MAG: efflux RND transporter periplasmic adaptor subunit [Deltaproteobacteria bacterium]|nr:efflux RND transporter periplasmic adaptor subunit [Candidatus Anaeroferrophillacea bacterium]